MCIRDRHVVVQRLVQCNAEGIVIDAGRIDEADVVFRKRNRRQGFEGDAILFGMQADRGMHGAGKAVEEAGLDAARGEQLPHVCLLYTSRCV